MVRVLLISVLAFGALVLVTQALPVVIPQAPVDPEEPAGQIMDKEAAEQIPVETPFDDTTDDDKSAFSDWEGTWHGTFNIYNMNGTLVSTVTRRIERVRADIGYDVWSSL